MNFVTHLECANCGQEYDARQVHNLCATCDRPLRVKYDLAALKRAFPRKTLAGRSMTLWRYLEMLPIADPSKIVSLAETVSPLLETKRLAATFGLDNLYVKDESRLPTGSFKARGMALALSKANEFGIQTVAAPTAGNAGGAMAAYGARAGMIQDILPPGSLTELTRLVLANAIYFKGVWAMQFEKSETSMQPFHLSTTRRVDVPLMHHFDEVGQHRR